MDTNGKDWIKQTLKTAQRFSKYDVGETIEGLAKRLGKAPSEIVKLNSNENFFVPINLLRSLLKEVVDEIDPRIYPRDEYAELKEALSGYLNTSPEEIVVGTGSDQLIDLLTRIFLRHGDEALSISPTFSMYKRCVELQGTKFIAVPLKEDFSLDVDGILALSTSKSKLLFLCSPNNPTANQFKPCEVQRLIEEFDGFVVIDEAYAEFAEKSIIGLTRKFENLVVLRTFSKAFGLAGLRLGYAVTNREIASTISERFQMPYSATLIALKMGIKLLREVQILRRAIEKLKAERSRMIKELKMIKEVKVFSSQTNFVLVQVKKNSKEIYEKLLRKGIIIRHIGRVLNLDNCLRVSVAPPEMTNKFLSAFKKVLGERVD